MPADQIYEPTRRLTRRQAEYVNLAVQGLSSKEIARVLGISPSTVDNHISTVMHIYNLPNRTALARYFTNPAFDFRPIGQDALVTGPSGPGARDDQPVLTETIADCSNCHLNKARDGAPEKQQNYAVAISIMAAALFATMASLIHYILKYQFHIDF